MPVNRLPGASIIQKMCLSSSMWLKPPTWSRSSVNISAFKWRRLSTLPLTDSSFFLTYWVCSGTCQGISRVYNQALGVSDIPNASRLSNELNGDLVLDSFLLYAILQDKNGQRETLSLPHHGYKEHRFDEALAERNYRMAGTGQPMWAHACNQCMKVYQGDDGNWCKNLFPLCTKYFYLRSGSDRITAGVHDGVTVRHLCCSVHDCQEALPTQRHYFCFSHQHLIKQCCIQSCEEPAQPGFRTCSIETHRAFQADADEQNAAMFQLRSRLRNAAISDVPLAGSSSSVAIDDPLAGLSQTNSAPPFTEASNLSTPASTPSTSTSKPSAPRVKGKLTRSWTHNEQLFVRCCGIIVSRATFFGSEGVSGVTVRPLKHTSISLINFIWIEFFKSHVPPSIPWRASIVHFLRQQLLISEAPPQHRREVL